MSKGECIKIATTQVSLEPVSKPELFMQRMEALIKDASNAGCAAILLPEYFALSLMVAISEGDTFLDKIRSFAKVVAPKLIRDLERFSNKHNLVIIGGSFPWYDQGRLINRSAIVFPNGPVLFQDKINMTRFEDEEWRISQPKSPKLEIFDLSGAKCAVAICYDVEFPSVCALAAEAGVEVLFVPSCTDDMHGYWRVRHCAHARTIENQCYAVLASVVKGDSRYSEISDHYGQGALLSPCDIGFPLRGILKEGELNQEGVVWTELNLSHLARIRQDGTVLNLRDRSKG